MSGFGAFKFVASPAAGSVDWQAEAAQAFTIPSVSTPAEDSIKDLVLPEQKLSLAEETVDQIKARLRSMLAGV